MKMYLGCLLVVLLLAVNVPHAQAAARPISQSGREYLLSARDFSGWSIGVYGEYEEREVEVNGFRATLENTRVMGYVGLDLAAWLTAYAAAGRGETRFDEMDSADSEMELAAGMNLKLIDHDMLDPTLHDHFLFDSLRLNAHGEVRRSQTEWRGLSGYGDELSWTTLDASLTLGLVNNVEGSKKYRPYNITLFGGPYYSVITAGDLEDINDMGFVAGFDVFWTAKVSTSLEIRTVDFDADAYSGSAGFGIRF